MTKKRVTKIDPKEKLARYLDHQSNQKKKKAQTKVSASLSQLHNERKTAIVKRLGLLVSVSLIILLGLGYYISPLANVSSVQVQGGSDLPIKEVVRASHIKSSDKVLDHLLNPKKINQRLAKQFTEIKNVHVSVKHINQLSLKITEHKTIGYIKTRAGYRKILNNAQLGTQLLSWHKVNSEKPVFVGYNHEVSLKQNLQLFNSLPSDFQDQIKLLSGNTRRKTQVIFVMKDGNVLIGNVSTLKDKLKYYNDIRNRVGKNSLIDLEVGAYSRPLTAKEKRIYGLR